MDLSTPTGSDRGRVNANMWCHGGKPRLLDLTQLQASAAAGER